MRWVFVALVVLTIIGAIYGSPAVGWPGQYEEDDG
jgi:hypothetical protein